MAHKKPENKERKRKPTIPYVRVQPTKKQKEKELPFYDKYGWDFFFKDSKKHIDKE